ncbi:MAG TPA: hypothetical protein VIY54_05000 [Steroidobacteraceae bacterium]
MNRVSDQSARQAFWSQWLAQHLAPALCQRLSGVVERDGTLVVFAESAAWSARLRYAMQELHGDIVSAQRGIQRFEVRVLPRAP